MFPEIIEVTPITYTTRQTYVEVVPGKDSGDKKFVETCYDTIIYDQNGNLDPVTRVNKVDYYA